MSGRVTAVVEVTAFVLSAVLVLLWAWSQNAVYEPWTAMCVLVGGGLELYRRFFSKGKVESGESTNDPLVKLKVLIPELLDEIRTDLKDKPLWREAVLMKKTWVFNGEHIFQYYYDEHDDLAAKFQILENHNLVSQIGYDASTPIYRFSEAFVESLSKS
jgi:hypothetical protein